MASVAVSSTHAYFSSSAAIAGNTFATGTITLQVNGGSGSAVFNEANMKPGDTIPQHIFTIANNGTLDANHLDLLVKLSGDTDLARYIVFPTSVANSLRYGLTTAGDQSVRLDVPDWTAGDTEYDIFNGTNGAFLYGHNAVPPLSTGSDYGMDRDGDGRVTLADLAVSKIRITPGTVNAGIAAGTTATLWINSVLDSATPDAMQDKSVSATFTWTLDQDASQF